MITASEAAAHAAGTAFFLFLSIIPMIMLVSGLLPEDAVVQKGAVNISQAVIPERVREFLAGIAASCHGRNMTMVSVSAAVIIWSASRGVLALIRGLNHIYDIDESRGYLLLRLKAAFYTVFLLFAIWLSAGLLVFGDTGQRPDDEGVGAAAGAAPYFCRRSDFRDILYHVLSAAESSIHVAQSVSGRRVHLGVLDALFVCFFGVCGLF